MSVRHLCAFLSLAWVVAVFVEGLPWLWTGWTVWVVLVACSYLLPRDWRM